MKKVKHILLVDDDEDDHFFHKRAIRESALRDSNIIIKNNGEEALSYLKSPDQGHPDLIFLDVNMPIMNGWELLQEFDDWKNYESSLLFMVSTFENPDDIKKVKSFKVVTDYIIKPLSKDILDAIVQKYLA